MRRVAAVLAAVVVLVVATGCEPKMTITAHTPAKHYCLASWQVTGTVTPASATKTVVLQHTYQHKWEDVPRMHAPGGVTAHVSSVDGTYTIEADTDYGTLGTHYRVRSLGGTAFSPDFYASTYGGTCTG